MDLSALSTASAHDNGSVMQVVHPELGPIEGMTITLAGPDSKRFLDKQRDLTDKRLADPGRKRKARDMEAEGIEVLAACTIAWTGFERNGKPIECSEKEAFRIYADHGFAWLRRQVDAHISERGNYSKPSQGAS